MDIFEMNHWITLGFGMVSPLAVFIMFYVQRWAGTRWEWVAATATAMSVGLAFLGSLYFFFALWVLPQVAWAYITGLFA